MSGLVNEADVRAQIVAEAQKWLRTPYHHRARVLGAGVDCSMLLAEVYEGAKLIEHVEPDYPPDWHLHRSEELYIDWLLRCGGVEIEGPPQPGDVAVWRFGRTFSHGAIVVAWPTVIQAYLSRNVEYASALDEPLASRPVRFFSLLSAQHRSH